MSLNQSLRQLHEKFPDTDRTTAIVFVGHGNPMNALEDNEFSRAWASVGKNLLKPKAILCISAHWETSGTQITGMDKPKTIHDLGFSARAVRMPVPRAGVARPGALGASDREKNSRAVG